MKRTQRLVLVTLWLIGCVLFGHHVVTGSTAIELRYRPRFEFGDPEYAEAMAFVHTVNDACVSGDVERLLASLTKKHANALRTRVARTLGRGLTAAHLRTMRRLLPLAGSEKRLVLGLARDSRVALVLAESNLAFAREAAAAICLTLVPLQFDGFRFRLAAPRLRQVPSAARDRLAAAMAEDWLSTGESDMTSAPIRPDAWPTPARR